MVERWISGAVLCGLLLTGCTPAAEQQAAHPGLFSWSEEALTAGGRAELLAMMRTLELESLYQAIPEDAEQQGVADLLAGASEAGAEVWLLTGDPAWGLQPDGAAMIGEIERAARYNQGLEEEIQLRGIVMDVEPYLTSAWETDQDKVMRAYTAAMEQACRAAERNGLALCACIPYYYDDLGFTAALEELVEQGCDSLVVMNYYRGDEAAQIETELSLARGAGKPLTVAYELQPPGSHGLTEQNTYYGLGLEAVGESYAAIVRRLGGEGLSYALHSYEALRREDAA